MSSLRSVLSECAAHELSKGRPNVEDIIDCAYRNHRDLFEQESLRLVRSACRSIVKELMRAAGDDDSGEQLELPGVRLPAAIAIRNDDGTVYYVRSDRATWPELLAGERERQLNVVAAGEKLKQYRDALARLRPLMADHPDRTVAEALALEVSA